jgi:hypothetical protein
VQDRVGHLAATLDQDLLGPTGDKRTRISQKTNQSGQSGRSTNLPDGPHRGQPHANVWVFDRFQERGHGVGTVNETQIGRSIRAGRRPPRPEPHQITSDESELTIEIGDRLPSVAPKVER